VLASSGLVERPAPFSPARSRLAKQRWAGLKGAASWTKAADARTAMNGVSEDRSEPQPSSGRGFLVLHGDDSNKSYDF